MWLTEAAGTDAHPGPQPSWQDPPCCGAGSSLYTGQGPQVFWELGGEILMNPLVPREKAKVSGSGGHFSVIQSQLLVELGTVNSHFSVPTVESKVQRGPGWGW